MSECLQFSRHRNRWQDKRQRQLARLAAMRAAKARKRLANSTEQEPKMLRYYPLELGVRNKVNGETAWIDLKSVRDSAKRLRIILKYYQPDA